MSTTGHAGRPATAGRVHQRGDRRWMRPAAVGGAIMAALAVWFVAAVVLGLDLRRPAASADEQAETLKSFEVAMAAAVGSLAGWALLAVLERLTSRPRRVWSVIAAVAILVSLSGPLSGSAITTTNRLVLVVMHLVVGAVVISALAQTAKASRTTGRRTLSAEA